MGDAFSVDTVGVWSVTGVVRLSTNFCRRLAAARSCRSFSLRMMAFLGCGYLVSLRSEWLRGREQSSLILLLNSPELEFDGGVVSGGGQRLVATPSKYPSATQRRRRPQSRRTRPQTSRMRLASRIGMGAIGLRPRYCLMSFRRQPDRLPN